MEASAIYTPKVTFSIVVYKQTVEELSATIQSVLQYNLPKVIYIVDNSPQDTASQLTQISDCIIYHHIPQNVRFGKAHNWAIEEAIKNGSQFHFIVNPDIYFKEDIVSPMLTYMESHPRCGTHDAPHPPPQRKNTIPTQTHALAQNAHPTKTEVGFPHPT